MLLLQLARHLANDGVICELHVLLVVAPDPVAIALNVGLVYLLQTLYSPIFGVEGPTKVADVILVVWLGRLKQDWIVGVGVLQEAARVVEGGRVRGLQLIDNIVFNS